MASTILAIENLSVAFADLSKPVVDRVNFSVNKGQCLGLVGESGSGKSLTALAILQLLPVTARVSQQSRINFDGTNLLNFSEREMRHVRGKKIGMIFQDAMSAFNPVFTIGHQLTEVIGLHHKLHWHHAEERALALLAQVGIKDTKRCLHCYPHQLSGGMRQRAMIAMALAGDPELLIADEPTTALDVTIQAQILGLLRQLIEQRQMSLIFISHDLAVVAKLADEIVVLQKGRKVEQAKSEDFFNQPHHAYSQQLLNAILPHQARKAAVINPKILLKVLNLQVYFSESKKFWQRNRLEVKAVDDISFEVAGGETFALIGESGCGKTTTAKAVLRLLPLTAGNILFNAIDLATLSRSALRSQRANLQIIFQDPYSALNPRMLVADCLIEGLIAQKRVASHRAALQQVDYLLQLVELPNYAKWRYPHEFSGGERQRICIARALALQPKLLILDEPTSALDVSIQKQMLVLLETLQNELGISYLLITHDFGVVAYLAHRVAVMQQGKIVEQGSAMNILQNPQHVYTQRLLADSKLTSKGE